MFDVSCNSVTSLKLEDWSKFSTIESLCGKRVIMTIILSESVVLSSIL